MALTPLAKQVQAIVDILSEEHDTYEDAARAVLAKAWELYEERGKFTVAAGLYLKNGKRPSEDDPDRQMKISLGLYPTLKQAEDAGRSLYYSTRTHDEWKWWALPVYHDTPASFHSMLKAERGEDVAEENDGWKKVIQTEVKRLRKLGEWIPNSWDERILEEGKGK